jgi:predicted dehydrogenase
MIRIGVLGCGYWGPNLIRNFHDLEGSQVIACSDVDTRRLVPIRHRYETIRVSDDPQELLRDPELDAVAIATPVSTHYGLAREALQHGKHVFIEKPLSGTSREAEDLVELAERQGRVLMVDHTFVYSGAVRKMKEIIEGGTLGSVYYYDAVRINLGLFQPDVNVVWDLASHDVSVLAYLLDDKPISVSAVGICHIDGQRENIAYVMIRYPSRVIAHIHVNWLAPVKVRRTLIGGSQKMIVYDDLEPDEKVQLYDKGVDITPGSQEAYQARVGYRLGDIYVPKIDRTEPLQLACEHFLDCIIGGRRPITDGVAGLNVVRILEAAQCSMETNGTEIKL